MNKQKNLPRYDDRIGRTADLYETKSSTQVDFTADENYPRADPLLWSGFLSRNRSFHVVVVVKQTPWVIFLSKFHIQ